MGALLTRKVVVTYLVIAIGGLIIIKVKHGNLEQILIGLVAGIAMGIDLARRYFGQKMAEQRSAHEYQLSAYQAAGAQAYPRELTAGPGQAYPYQPDPATQYGQYAGHQPGQPAPYGQYNNWQYGVAGDGGQIPREGYGDPTRGY